MRSLRPGKLTKLTTLDMELAVSDFLNYRVNLIVPNISWGFGLHECDLLVITKSNCLWEVEIKISKADLIKDKKKYHRHRNDKISRLYFAVPDYLESETEHIPDKAGIIIVSICNGYYDCKLLRKPKINGIYKISDSERSRLAHLGCMRLWRLKQKLGNALKEMT